LATLFHHQTGQTVHAFLTQVRVHHAAALIRAGEKIEAVSLLVGYRSKKNFYRHFKEQLGVTPTVYRDRSGRPDAAIVAHLATAARLTAEAPHLPRVDHLGEGSRSCRQSCQKKQRSHHSPHRVIAPSLRMSRT
jgi:AraC-like DNA-binding protein